MPCEKKDCANCQYLDECNGEMGEDECDEDRECGDECSHYDNINQCCWQATEKGLCFDVSEGDLCHLGYKRKRY